MPTNPYYSGPVSDHFDGVRFFNPAHPSTDRRALDLLRWRLLGKRPVWQAAAAPQRTPPKKVGGLRVTLVGHATLLIQGAGRNILVDPVWSERASPVPWAGPVRFNAPAIAFEALPPIDTVLLTHNHYDHLDMPTLRRLWETHRPRIVAPLGNDRVVARLAPSIAVETLDWHQRVELDRDAVLWLHPAKHWSARGWGDRRMALWGGFFLQWPVGKIYVSGDTGYGDGDIFRDVRMRHGAPDVAILPIGAYEPRGFMRDQHVNPAEAVQIMRDCGAAQALGVHWGTFALSDEQQFAPPDELRRELDRLGVPPTSFLAMRPGDSWTK